MLRFTQHDKREKGCHSGHICKICVLFQNKMEVPIEVVEALSLTQSAVLPVVCFKPGKIAFQTVG